MGQYLVLIYENEQEGPWAAGEETVQRVHAAHGAFGERHSASLRGGNALEPSSTATTLRKNGAGEVVATDGPFAETKEAIGGYYVIEAADLDEAIAIAKDVPAEFGGVEVRPIHEMS